MTNELDQWFTPLWLAEALVDARVPLGPSDTVLEPCCGLGAFLKAIPDTVSAYGVEIDPKVAEQARSETDRQIIVGDIRTVQLSPPTIILGNPPFDARLFDIILSRSLEILPQDGLAAFILPVHFFQTASRVCRYSESWSIAQEMLPRNAFHSRMRSPLVFARFIKSQDRTLVGFLLYPHSRDVQRLRRRYRKILESQTGSTWRRVCAEALVNLGGRAALPEIYREVEGCRPSLTQFWHEKIRQTLRVYTNSFTALGEGHYELAETSAAVA